MKEECYDITAAIPIIAPYKPHDYTRGPVNIGSYMYVYSRYQYSRCMYMHTCTFTFTHMYTHIDRQTDPYTHGVTGCQKLAKGGAAFEWIIKDV